MKFAGTVHHEIDEIIALERLGRSHERVGPRIEPADVLAVEDLDRRTVLRCRRRARGFVLGEHSLDVAWKGGAQAIRFAHPLPHIGGRICDDDRGESGRALQRVLHREHSTPTLADEVDAIEAERRA